MSMLFFLWFVFAFGEGCSTTSSTSTRDSSGVTSIHVSSEGELTVTVVDSLDSNLLANVAFYGRDPIGSIFSESISGGEWSLTFGASAPTAPPPPSSSANSMIFFSAASQTIFFSPVVALASQMLVYGQCSETSSVELVRIYLYYIILFFWFPVILFHTNVIILFAAKICV